MRVRTYIPMLAFALLLSGPTLFAQESSREDFEELCDAIEGRWVGEVTWVADWPGFGKKGDKVAGYAVAKRSLDGNALVGQFYGGAGMSRFTIAYDAGSRQIREFNVSSGGTIREIIHEIDGDTWTRTISGSNPDGMKVSGMTKTKISGDGDLHRWSGTMTIGDQKSEDVQDVWRRISKGDAKAAESSIATNRDFDDYCDAFEGRWIGDVTWIDDWPGFGKKGEQVTAYLDVERSADGNVLLSKFLGGAGAGYGITFYDAGEQKIREISVSSGGTIWTGVASKKDGQWTGAFTGSNPDGKKIKGEYKTQMASDGNSYQNSGSTTVGGKPADELQDKWRRVGK